MTKEQNYSTDPTPLSENPKPTYNELVKYSLSEHGTLDFNLHNPVPPNAKPIITPPGTLRKDFVAIIEASVLIHQLSAGMTAITSREIKAHVPRLTLSVIEKCMQSKQYHNMMVLRGVINEADGLSGEQMRALSIMTDTASNLNLTAKLKKAGIPWYKWQAWQNDPLFRAHHDRLANELFKKAQASVDEAVVTGATAGKLEFIKYFNEISGKHDPQRRAHQDVQTILNGIVEIVTRNVTDPDTLRQISAELSAVVAKLG